MVAHISRAAFRRWAQIRPKDRFERADGRVVPITPERIAPGLTITLYEIYRDVTL